MMKIKGSFPPYVLHYKKRLDFILKVPGHLIVSSVLFTKQWKCTKKNTECAHMPSIRDRKVTHFLP